MDNKVVKYDALSDMFSFLRMGSMERHPEWFERKSTSSGFVIYWGVKLKKVV